MKIHMRWILLVMVAMMFIIQTIESRGIEVDPSEYSTEPSTENPTEASTENTETTPILSHEEAKARATFRRKEKKKYRDAAFTFHKCLGMDFKDCKRKLYRCVIDKSRSECMKEVDCFMNEVKICTKDLQDFKNENSKSSELETANSSIEKKKSDDDSENSEVSETPSTEMDELDSSGENDSHESKIHKKSKKIMKNEESEEASEESEEPSDEVREEQMNEVTEEQMNEVNSETTTDPDISSTIWDGFWER